MDDKIHPTEYNTEPYDPAIYEPLGRDVAGEVMDTLRRRMEQLKRDEAAGLDSIPPMPLTIRQAAEKTGRPRHEIYRLIKQGKVKARLAPDGPALWLIPGEELKKLSGPA